MLDAKQYLTSIWYKKKQGLDLPPCWNLLELSSELIKKKKEVTKKGSEVGELLLLGNLPTFLAPKSQWVDRNLVSLLGLKRLPDKLASHFSQYMCV